MSNDIVTKYEATVIVTTVEGAGPAIPELGSAASHRRHFYERVTAEEETGRATLTFDSTEHGRHRRGDRIAITWTHSTETS